MPHSGSSKRRNLNPSITYSDFVAISQWAKRNRWQILMAAGILIRTLGYAMSRAFWLDESSLYGNVFDQPAFDVMTQLKHEQVVPPGFLIVLRFTYQIFGQNENSSCLQSSVKIIYLPVPDISAQPFSPSIQT